MAAWLYGQFILLLTSLIPSAAMSPPPTTFSAPPNVCLFEPFELRVAGADTSQNPFDSRRTPLATFSLDNTPGRNVSVRAFLFQNYTRSWDGDAEQLHVEGDLTFLVRFAPPASGLWTWTVRNHANTVISRGTLQAVACSNGSRPADGFVRVSASGQHFVLSNSGRGIFPVGENVAMPPRRNGTYAMEHYLQKLLAHHANAFRMWLGPSLTDNNISYPACPGTFSGPSFCTSPLILETRPRHYSLENAWRVDWILQFAQQHGMYAHVVLDSWPQEMRSGEWNFSVLNAANGGPLVLPFNMYDSIHSTVTDQWAQRLAYVGARFGAFRSVLGWELINEPDTPYMYSPKSLKTRYPELQTFPLARFIPWIQHLAHLLKTQDQGQHLVTTNFASSGRMGNLTVLPEIDFLGTHDYQYQGGSHQALHTGIVKGMQQHLRYWGLPSKPAFVSENGMIPAKLEASDDPNGRGMKNSLWGSVTSGTAAADFSWWWDGALIDSPNHTAYYAHYDGIARFVEQIDFPGYNWTTHVCNCKATPTACVSTCVTGVPLDPLDTRVNNSGVTLLWARNANFTYVPSTGPLSVVTNASVEIVCMYSLAPPLPAAGSTIQWFNTTTGEAIGAPEPALIAPGPKPNPPYPMVRLTRPFLEDIAAVIRGPVQQVRCEGGSHPPIPPSPPPPSPSPSPSPLDATIRNGVPWYDTDGERMYFGGANMYQEGGLYYLVGSGKKVADISECFNLYRSADLEVWTNLGCVLNISNLRVPPPFTPPFRMERPKLFRCPSVSDGPAYRLVFHCDTRNFNMRSIGVLVADHIEGPYVQHGPCFRPDEEDSYDMGTFVDDVARGGDGRAYLIRSVNNEYAGISAFDSECMNTTGIISHGPTIEGQALMRSATDKALYVAGSHLTGWHPNPAVFGRATGTTLYGAKWEVGSLYNPSGDPTTFNTQSSFIFPFTHKDGHITYIWMADRWNEGIPDPLPGGLQNWTSVWLPLLPPQPVNTRSPAKPQPGWEVRLESCRVGDTLQQFTLTQNTLRHSSGFCVERPRVRSVSPLVLAPCDGASASQRWLRGSNGSIVNSTASPTGGCVAWNVFGDLLKPGDPVIAWPCLHKWDEQWDLPAGVTPGQIKAMTSTGIPSHLCATVLSNNSGRWTLPWKSSWSLKDY